MEKEKLVFTFKIHCLTTQLLLLALYKLFLPQSLFSFIEYPQISFNVTEVCFVLRLNKKMHVLEAAPLTRFYSNKYSGSLTKIF